MNTQFKVGDKVYDKNNNQFGIVQSIKRDVVYPVNVNFNGCLYSYTLDGRPFLNCDIVLSNKIGITKSLITIIKSFFKRIPSKSVNITVKKINSAKIIIN